MSTVNRGYPHASLTSTLNVPSLGAEASPTGVPEICIPDKDVSGYRTEESYKFLEDDGIVFPEAEMKEGEVVIGKVSPPKFLSEARNISIQTKKENSTAIKQEETGVVDAVFITHDKEGNRIIQIRTRELRVPEIGDKFSVPKNDWDYNRNKASIQKETDRILDKISKNGYGSLTKEEKDFLFRQKKN